MVKQMSIRSLRSGVVIAAILSVVAVRLSADQPEGSAPSAAALRARGLQLAFNLDHAEAEKAFNEAIAADPNDPTAHRLAAAIAWIRALYEQGAVTADDYLGRARTTARRQPPDPELSTIFHEHMVRAMALAEERRRTADNADAHFQIGAAYGFQASYAATVEGRMFDSFRAARRAYSEHQRVLELDPNRKDAGMIVGTYRYGVSVLPFLSRFVARIVGFGGGRDQGITLVEDAARYPSDVQTNARFTLIVIYNRESRYDDALKVIEQLQQQYPRNRLLWLEAGSTSLRAGRYAQAKKTLEEGLAKLAGDTRPRAFGELARWRYVHGATLLALRETDAAARELNAALQDPARESIQGRVHIELGKLADLAANRERATGEYRQAIRLCTGDEDETCVKDAKAFIKTGYR
jgi:tetratricopeptide (TPR) repeat protein